MNVFKDKYYNGFLVVKRINYFLEPKYDAKPIKSSVDKKAEDVIKYYRGIEGEPWPLGTELFRTNTLDSGLLPFEQYDLANRYYKAANDRFNCDFIFLESYPKVIHNKLDSYNFTFCGFDYGLFDSEYNYYSAIFHEIIYGQYEELRGYSKYLNRCLLLPEFDILLKYEKRRHHLLKEGYDLETSDDNETFSPIPVFGLKKEGQ